MKKNRVVLVDSDAEFLAPLEAKFLQSVNEDLLDLEVITETDYLIEYFSKPVSVDILVVSDELIDNIDLDKHSNIPKIFEISEKVMDFGGTDDLRIRRIDRYTNLQAQYNIITADLSEASVDKSTDVILFYSATGGVGKTTLALSMANRLAKEGQKVLYIDAERINSFQYYIDNKGQIPNSILSEFSKPDRAVFQKIKHIVRTEGFDYLPPFGAALKSYNVNFGVYVDIINSAKATNEYDVIVVDTDSVYDADKQSLLSLANKVVIVMLQQAQSQFALAMLSKSVSFNDTSKYYFVCNKFDDEIGMPNVGEFKFQINEYISRIENIDQLSIDEISKNAQIANLAYAIV